MEIKRLHRITFSPTGNSEKISGTISSAFSCPKLEYDLMKEQIREQVELPADDLLVISIPVFEGRVPKFCLESLKNLYGNNTPAITAVSFGCRAYDDALIELCDILGGNGICVIAAGGFASEHSVLHRLGRHRPDDADLEEIKAFAAACADKLARTNACECTPVAVPGERPYRTVSGGFSLVPTGDENCTKCLKCFEVCPANAIDRDFPAGTDADKCATCYACAVICPVRCRMPRDPALPEVLGYLLELVDKRALNETFI